MCVKNSKKLNFVKSCNLIRETWPSCPTEDIQWKEKVSKDTKIKSFLRFLARRGAADVGHVDINLRFKMAETWFFLQHV